MTAAARKTAATDPVVPQAMTMVRTFHAPRAAVWAAWTEAMSYGAQEMLGRLDEYIRTL